MFKNLSKKQQSTSLEAAIQTVVQEAVNFDKPGDRAGAELYLILNPQFGLLGVEGGSYPRDNTFASKKCLGAVLGTALYVALKNYERSDTQGIVDTVSAAFVLVYGGDIGLAMAKETFESAPSDDVISWASDWAFKDAEGARRPGSATTPAAFYLAATNMI